MTAPVTLVTGLPGNGKTLYTVCMVKEWAAKENRQVYVHGIEILDKQSLPWIEFDPLKWHEMPEGAIIVIDEAHKTFPNRPTGSQVPPHVLAIAELRHKGHNLVIITQHPMEIDSAVRRRVGRHLQVVRRFGAQACAIKEWSRCVENCDKTDKDAIKHEWLYNKTAYGWYKSAEIHTIKRKIPAKVLWLAVAPIAVVGAVVMVVHVINKQRSGQYIAQAAGLSASAPAGAGAGFAGAPGRDQPMTPAQYAAAFAPRVPGLAYTAPIYDKVTAPVRAPYPAACVLSKTRCQCYTQQGTRLDVTADLCKGIATGGFFMAWDDRSQSEVPRPLPVAPVQKLAGGTINEPYNLTPSAEVVAAADREQTDGRAIRAMHRRQ